MVGTCLTTEHFIDHFFSSFPTFQSANSLKVEMCKFCFFRDKNLHVTFEGTLSKKQLYLEIDGGQPSLRCTILKTAFKGHIENVARRRESMYAELWDFVPPSPCMNLTADLFCKICPLFSRPPTTMMCKYSMVAP